MRFMIIIVSRSRWKMELLHKRLDFIELVLCGEESLNNQTNIFLQIDQLSQQADALLSAEVSSFLVKQRTLIFWS